MLNNDDILSRIAQQYNLKFVVDASGDQECVVLEGLDSYKRDDDCIFIGCEDNEVKSLLTAWLMGELKGDRDVDFQLSRLLAARGRLVCELATKVVHEESWEGYNCKQMFLSYICNMQDFVTLLSQSLFTMPSDFRDGLFVAAMYSGSYNVDEILIDAFSRWYKSGEWFPAGTGEDGWLEYFLKKWIKIWPLEKIKVPLSAYFDVCV